MTQETPPSPWWKSEYLLLTLILLIGAGLRIARSGYDVLTFDEQWHLELSTARGSVHETMPWDVIVPSAPPTGTLKGAPPWYRIWSSLGEAVHPPLYFITLRLWRDIMGEGIQAARSLSILFSLLTIVLIFEAGRRSIGRWPALGAALLFAVAPNQVYMAQQVRGYAMLQCVAMSGLLLVVLNQTSDRPRIVYIVLLGVAVLAMMLTHYFAIGGAVAIGLYAVLGLRGRTRWLALAALLVAAAVYSAIWIPWAMPQIRYVRIAGDWLGDDRGLKAKLSTMLRVISAPWREISTHKPGYIDQNPRFSEPWVYLGGILFFLPPLLMRRKPGMLIWYLWLLGTIGFLAILDLARSTTHLRFTRYIAIAAPAVFGLTASLLEQSPQWIGRAIFAVIILAALGLNPQTYQKEEGDWASIGRILDEHAQPGEAIVVYQGTVPRPSFAGYYYLAAGIYSDAFPRPVLKLSAPAARSLVEQLPGQTAWLITTPEKPAPSDVLPATSVIEQYPVPGLVTCSRVRLRSAPASQPPGLGDSSPP